tara:strand:- start:62134 stop:63177 length:1044 start_codon:yes stop_codon:yes gene_type:complete
MAMFFAMVGCAAGVCVFGECDRHQHAEPEQQTTVESHTQQLAHLQSGPIEIPISTQTGHIVMEAWIQGDGPHWFVLDTGNQQTTIYASMAERLGLETKHLGQLTGAGSGSMSVQMANDVRVGFGAASSGGERPGFVEREATVLPDAAMLPAFGDKTVTGFLGGSMIERFVTSIDYGHDRLILTPRDEYAVPEGATVMEMKLAFGFPYFEGSVTPILNGESLEPVVGNFLFDLGATYGVEIDYEHAKAGGLVDADDPEQKIRGKGQGIDGVIFEMRLAPADSISMGGIELDDREVLFMTTPGGGPPIENLVGAVGSGSFEGMVVTLDYAGERLILTPSSDQSQDQDSD